MGGNETAISESFISVVLLFVSPNSSSVAAALRSQL